MALSWLMAADDLWEGEVRRVVAGGRALLVARVNNEVVAYDDVCPHQGVRLSDGSLLGTVVRCRAHHWEYDLTTGEGVNPTHVCLRSHRVLCRGGELLVELAPDTIPDADTCQRDGTTS